MDGGARARLAFCPCAVFARGSMEPSPKGSRERLMPIKAAVEGNGHDAGLVHEQAKGASLQSKSRHVLPRRLSDRVAEDPMQVRGRAPGQTREGGQVEFVFEVRLNVHEQGKQRVQLREAWRRHPLGRRTARSLGRLQLHAMALGCDRSACAPPR